jgi:hypothetical protein
MEKLLQERSTFKYIKSVNFFQDESADRVSTLTCLPVYLPEAWQAGSHSHSDLVPRTLWLVGRRMKVTSK